MDSFIVFGVGLYANAAPAETAVHEIGIRDNDCTKKERRTMNG